MDVDWTPDNDGTGDWTLYFKGDYVGLLVMREGRDVTYHFNTRANGRPNLHTSDLEEAKALAVAIWAFNK